ncbi:MAG TPA: nucleotide exchange factor GrpE, partial [Fimbriimonas sp.]
MAKEEMGSEEAGSLEPQTAENEAGQAVENDIERLSVEVQKLTSERDDLQQQVLRTMADFQNFRRRNQEQAAQMRHLATENLVNALLPVL